MAYVQERRSAPRIDCYSRSYVDENVQAGLVMDISKTGACLTVPKNTHIFKNVDPGQSVTDFGCLLLNIFHPDDSLENALNIRAGIVWFDHKYSKDRLKFGVQFSEMDAGKSDYVNKFINWMQKKENYFLHCEIEKC